MKPPRPALTGRGPTSIIVANTYGEDDTLAAKDARPPSRNLDAARLLGHYRTMLRIRAFEFVAAIIFCRAAAHLGKNVPIDTKTAAPRDSGDVAG